MPEDTLIDVTFATREQNNLDRAPPVSGSNTGRRSTSTGELVLWVRNAVDSIDGGVNRTGGVVTIRPLAHNLHTKVGDRVTERCSIL
jgi:hypothetical protein